MPVKQGPTQRQLQAQARREQIMEVALTLFSDQGFSATSTKQIAQQVGITEGLLYHYFPTKVELLMELVKRRHLLEGGLIEIVQHAEGRPAPEVMTDLTERILILAHEHAPLLRILLGEAQVNADLHSAMSEMIDSMVHLLTRYLTSRVVVGEVRSDINLHTSVMGFLGGMLLFFMTHHRLDAQVWQQQATPYMHQWLTIWLQGILVS